MSIFKRHRASEKQPQPILRILSTRSPNEMAGRICPLRRGSNVIGRVEQVDVVIKDQLISRQHACITVSNDQAKFTIQDNNSRNGTCFKDGSRISDKPQPITPGTILVLGTTEVVLEYEGEPQASGGQAASEKTSLSLGIGPITHAGHGEERPDPGAQGNEPPSGGLPGVDTEQLPND